MIRNPAFLVILLLSAPVCAGEVILGPVLADIVKVRDGDSVDVVAHVWPGTDIRVSVRIRGIDAPELRGKCVGESALAQQSRSRLQELLAGGPVSLSKISGGKYFGRVLADMFTETGHDVGVEMLKSGHARPYQGRRRQSWCEKTVLLEN